MTSFSTFTLRRAAFALGAIALASAAQAETYSCKVYCNSGTTTVNISASSKADAAAKIDSQGHQICKADGKGNASGKTMSPDQCSRN